MDGLGLKAYNNYYMLIKQMYNLKGLSDQRNLSLCPEHVLNLKEKVENVSGIYYNRRKR